MTSKTKFTAMILCAIAALTISCNQPGSKQSKSKNSGLSSDSVIALAEQAYIFGYPLVIMDATKNVSTNFEQPVPNTVLAPVNQFGHFSSFPDASFKDVVKPNNDTYYSCAWLNLKAEPMVLSVPNTNDRYYLLPMLDAYTNVFASPGKRTTGTEAGDYLITGPGYKGTVPANMKEIKALTNMVWILGRTQCNSPQDGATTVKKIQDGYRLIPLSKWGGAFTPEKNKIDTTISKTPPPVLVEKMDIESFFKKLNLLMAENPPAPADSSLMNRLKAIGIGAGGEFNPANYNAETQSKLKAIPESFHRRMREALGKMGTLENGWNVTRTGMGSYGTDYRQRALVALIGLGATLNEDACYPNSQVDDKGEKFNGSDKYVIHFEKGQTPPANAFWSITMYGSDELLVANPINRFAIGDRNELKYNKDGSLDIYIQNENPGKDKVSNWLPAPKEGFSLTMRIYWPKEEFLNGSWKIPPVKVVN